MPDDETKDAIDTAASRGLVPYFEVVLEEYDSSLAEGRFRIRNLTDAPASDLMLFGVGCPATGFEAGCIGGREKITYRFTGRTAPSPSFEIQFTAPNGWRLSFIFEPASASSKNYRWRKRRLFDIHHVATIVDSPEG